MRNQLFETWATLVPARSIEYSCSTMSPLASMSPPSATSIEKRSRKGVRSAFATVATLSPSRSISIVSRMLTIFFRIVNTSSPAGVSRTRVFRIRSALPSTLNAG
jgi:hypothetical protein